MDEMNACTECGFTTSSIQVFTSHIEHHEEEHNRSSSGELSHTPTIEWTEESESPTPSPPVTPAEGHKTASSPRRTIKSVLSEQTVIQESPIYKESSVIQELPSNGTKTNKTVHVCPHCNFTTFMSQHMKSHLEAHERHQGQMYQCDICQMQFSQKANMHRHRMRHSGVKPYECRYCKKRFFRKDQMQEHSMTHIKTGVDFDCPVAFCTLQFSQHSTLRSHLDEMHNISAASPASCKRCSLLFANSRRLLLHYQTRHDDSETANTLNTSSKKDVADPPVKRKRASPAVTTVVSPTVLADQIQRIVKTDLSPIQNSDSSDQSSSPDYENPNNYSMSSEDLLMMCLSGNTALPHPAIAAANKLSVEQAMRLWSGDTGTMISPATEQQVHSPSIDSGSSNVDVVEESTKESMECNHCGIVFFDHTMHLLHKGLHTEGDPWRCNLCGVHCMEKYMFTTHVIFANHSS